MTPTVRARSLWRLRAMKRDKRVPRKIVAELQASDLEDVDTYLRFLDEAEPLLAAHGDLAERPGIWVFRHALAEGWPIARGRLAEIRKHDTFGPLVEDITDAELLALVVYTQDGFFPINLALRSAKEANLQHLRLQIELIESALAKLPAYRGAVDRETKLDGRKLRAYQPGKVVSDAAFVSTSSDKERVFAGTVRFKLRSRSGRSIDFVSHYPGEAEVLFSPGTRFEVVSRKAVDDGEIKLEITLKELPQPKRRAGKAAEVRPGLPPLSDDDDAG